MLIHLFNIISVSERARESETLNQIPIMNIYQFDRNFSYVVVFRNDSNKKPVQISVNINNTINFNFSDQQPSAASNGQNQNRIEIDMNNVDESSDEEDEDDEDDTSTDSSETESTEGDINKARRVPFPAPSTLSDHGEEEDNHQ